jgi:type I restriction enzyme, S subunit
MNTTSGWPLVPLGDALTHFKEYIDKPEPRQYPKLSVRLYGKGVVLDSSADGSILKMQRHQLARTGQVILFEIWGKKGAIGFVPEEGHGALCTSHFFLFDVNEDRVERGWLRALFRANYLADQLGSQAFGTTGYAAVRPNALLAAKIPLPPLEKQRRIVAKIERLSGKIAEIQGLRKHAADECDQLCRAILRDNRYGEPVPTPMRDLVTWRKPNVRVDATETYHFAGIYCFGRGVFRGERKTGMDFAYKQLTQIRTGDFVYPKLMAWEGALAVVPEECDGLYVSPEFPVFTINEERVLPEVLDVYFRSPTVWPLLSGVSTGTNVRRRRLNPNDFLNYQFPLPPRQVQLALRVTRGKMNLLRPLQDQKPQIDALLLAILDRAFKGAL